MNPIFLQSQVKLFNSRSLLILPSSMAKSDLLGIDPLWRVEELSSLHSQPVESLKVVRLE